MKTRCVTPSPSVAMPTRLAAIAGPIAEALHGIPDELKERTESIYLSDAPDMLEVLEELYHPR